MLFLMLSIVPGTFSGDTESDPAEFEIALNNFPFKLMPSTVPGPVSGDV